MNVIYHLATCADWQAATNTYTASSASGTVLCVDAEHYVALANQVFLGRCDLLLLCIDITFLNTAPRLTEINGLPAFAIDGPLPLTAVFEVAEFAPAEDGYFAQHYETHALTLHAGRTLADAQARALEVMSDFFHPWWIAGGWALDSFLGVKTRPHADLEISILADDQSALYQHLRGWDLRIAAPGAHFRHWDGQRLAAPYHQIWARQGSSVAATPEEFSADPTMLDVLIEDHVGAIWQYRRDRRVARPMAEFGLVRDGMPFVRPEIALLFKAKAPRYKDQRDFERAAPLLDAEARSWLRTALATAHPQSDWAAHLGTSR
jgi:uncharacterized protein (DUF952 family)